MSSSGIEALKSLQADADDYFGGDLYQAIIALKTKEYPDFLALIDTTMLEVIADLEANKNIYKDFGEDALTTVIVSSFNRKGFQVEHDANRGGHCDIVIERNKFQWLCEAKDYSSYTKLWDGYHQLTTRYSTGRSHADHGALLIYNKKEYAYENITNWQKELFKEEISPPISLYSQLGNKQHFYSTQKHSSSGQEYTVKHYTVLLHHEPKDRQKKQL